MNNRNPIMESWRLRRAGTGGKGSHKSRNAPRGGQRNVQAGYLAEYLDEVDETLSETANHKNNEEEDAMTLIARRPIPAMKGGLLFLRYGIISQYIRL